MNFVYDEALKEHMQRVGKRNVVVEMVTAETSDIEITELHVYLADDKRLAFLKEKMKRYRSYETEMGEVLFPAFPLQCKDEIHFWLKKFLCFKSVGYDGIKL